MEIIQVDRDAGMELISILDLKPVCQYCGVAVTNKNFGGVFSKPSRVVCDNIICLVLVED